MKLADLHFQSPASNSFSVISFDSRGFLPAGSIVSDASGSDCLIGILFASLLRDRRQFQNTTALVMLITPLKMITTVVNGELGFSVGNSTLGTDVGNADEGSDAGDPAKLPTVVPTSASAASTSNLSSFVTFGKAQSDMVVIFLADTKNVPLRSR